MKDFQDLIHYNSSKSIGDLMSKWETLDDLNKENGERIESYHNLVF